MSAKIGLIERFLYNFAPLTAIKRAKARLYLETLQSKRIYEAAARTRRTSGWLANATSANAETLSSLQVLRSRSRDLTRNDGFASKAIQTIVENTVGTGIIAKPTGKASAKNKAAAIAWKKWAESTDCDFDNRNDFYGIQAICMREMAEAGEVLVRKIKTTDEIPLRLQVLEADFLDITRNLRLSDGGYIAQGVEFDKRGKRVAYHIWENHPGDSLVIAKSILPLRIPADEIIHMYRVDRASQVRGVPWGASVLLALKDLNEYQDAQLIKQKLASAFVGFVYDSEPPVDSGDGVAPIDKMEPGTLEYLPPGKDIKFSTPPDASGYGEYTASVLRHIAAGFGIPYESLTGDFSQVNFSSGRMGWLEFQRNIEAWRWRILIPNLCNPAFEWFKSAAFLAGYGDLSQVGAEWTPPKREMIDPTKEIAATQNAVRSGFMSLPEAIRQSGYDPETVLAEISESNKLLDKYALILDSDPRTSTKAGIAQIPQDNGGAQG